jgi:hypothetical protein
LSQTSVHFGLVISKMGISQTIFLVWLHITILPISASQGARIMSHQHSAKTNVFIFNIINEIMQYISFNAGLLQ